MSRILFKPHEYRALSEPERELLAEGYLRAIDVVRKNVTPKGFSACSLADNTVYGTDANYRSVWARDGAITALWTIDLEDEDIRKAQVDTFETLLSKQGPNGQIPANVNIETGEPEYAGVGGIASIDSVMWIIIGIVHLCEARNDWRNAMPAACKRRWIGWARMIPTTAACSKSRKPATGRISSASAIMCSTTRCCGTAASIAIRAW